MSSLLSNSSDRHLFDLHSIRAFDEDIRHLGKGDEGTSGVIDILGRNGGDEAFCKGVFIDRPVLLRPSKQKLGSFFWAVDFLNVFVRQLKAHRNAELSGVHLAIPDCFSDERARAREVSLGLLAREQRRWQAIIWILAIIGIGGLIFSVRAG